MKALPTLEQRQMFRDIINNQDIFPDELIYRRNDPWFGKSQTIRSLFLAGINPSFAKQYIEAMYNHHWNKRVEFGQIKTARALDSNFRVKYEVVYLELVDNLVNQGRGPEPVVPLSNRTHYWYDTDGNTYEILYPNSFENMRNSVGNALGYQHRGALPDWMTSTQEGAKPLNFVNAVVLAYTVPGASKLIAYRLNTSGMKFSNVDFVLDRYLLDNGLSENFNVSLGEFNRGAETTFDMIQLPGQIKHSVDFAITNIPFDNINNQTVAFVKGLGGFDGNQSFNDGDTVIFVQQENFIDTVTNPYVTVNANNGWNMVTETGTTVIPGYMANLLDPTVPNQRAGIWRIRIVNAPDSFVPTDASDYGSTTLGFDSKPYDFTVAWRIPQQCPHK